MRGAGAALALVLLAACGADGRPVPPSEAREAGPSVSLSGTASLGIVRRAGG